MGEKSGKRALLKIEGLLDFKVYKLLLLITLNIFCVKDITN